MNRDEDGLSPAALGAILNGDLGNAMAAMLPGGIERQEADGQRSLVRAADRLPVRGTVEDRPLGYGERNLRAEWEATGFRFGERLMGADAIFVACTFPAGWGLRPTGHSMWSDVVDSHGRRRAAVFFKAAFYDYNAHTFGLECRYRVGTLGTGPDDAAPYRVGVLDDGTGEFVQVFETFPDYSPAFRYRDEKCVVLEARLAEMFPDHKNPLAYWD